MLGFIFCHGWGYDPSFWDNLKPYFKGYKCIFWDLGYFGPSALPIAIDESVKWIGIGHSLGFLKLLNSPISWHKLIGLQAFLNFQGHAPSLKRKRSRDLLKLQNHFEEDAIGALLNFHKLCGMQPPYQIMNIANLQKDLAILATTHSLREKLPCLILGCEDDLIVTKAVVQDNFSQYPQVQIVMHDKGLHTLGFSEPEFVKNTIFGFLDVK